VQLRWQSTSGSDSRGLPLLTTPEFAVRLSDLHRRLCQGDNSAFGALCVLILPPISDSLQRRFTADPDLIHDGALDALLAYWQKPEAYDPSRGVPLSLYLLEVARRRVSNLLRSERRLKKREETAAQEIDREAKEQAEAEPESPFAIYLSRERLDRSLDVLDDSRDKAFLRLLAAEENDIGRLASALGHPDRPQSEQEAAVRRARDRIRKQLERKGLRK